MRRFRTYEREPLLATLADTTTILPIDTTPRGEYALNRARYEHGFSMPIGRCQTVGEPGHRMHILHTRTGPPAVYVVVEDQHYGGGRPRLFQLPDVVHLLQNVTEDEAQAIARRPPR